MNDLYALHLPVSHMEPIIPAGSIITIDPHQTPQRDDLVVIWSRDGKPRVMKMLLSLPPEGLVEPEGEVSPLVMVGQTNPEKTYEVPLKSVVAIHKIVHKETID